LQDFSVIYDVNMRRQKTALSHWFPKIEAAGIPVPKTTIITMPKAAQSGPGPGAKDGRPVR
jgi:hypothetical protein